MTEVVVRYEPETESLEPHALYYNGRRGSIFTSFLAARAAARALSGGKLPRINSFEYNRMFPDRVRVSWGLGEFIVLSKPAAKIERRHPTHAAAMTAAHQLATETTGDKR